MSTPFKYSTDQDFKSRLESFETDHPEFDTDGLTDWQKDMLFQQDDESKPLEAEDIVIEDSPETTVKAPVTAPISSGSDSLTPAEARSLLVTYGVPVGKRGRLSPDQWAKARDLLAQHVESVK